MIEGSKEKFLLQNMLVRTEFHSWASAWECKLLLLNLLNLFLVCMTQTVQNLILILQIHVSFLCQRYTGMKISLFFIFFLSVEAINCCMFYLIGFKNSHGRNHAVGIEEDLLQGC